MHKDYKIRKLVEADLVALIELNWQMYHEMSAEATYYGSLKHLMLELETPGSIFIGLFKDDVLVGFAKGYPFNKLKFTFSGLYVNMKYNKNLRYLIVNFFASCKEAGYSSVELKTTSQNVIGLAKKFGGSVKETIMEIGI